MTTYRGRWRVVYTPAVLAEAKRREADFLSIVLPAVLKCARNRLWRYAICRSRRFRSADKDDEAQEVAGLAWRHFVDRIRLGADPLRCVGYIAKMTIRAVASRHGLFGVESRGDLLSHNAQRFHGFKTHVASFHPARLRCLNVPGPVLGLVPALKP